MYGYRRPDFWLLSPRLGRGGTNPRSYAGHGLALGRARGQVDALAHEHANAPGCRPPCSKDCARRRATIKNTRELARAITQTSRCRSDTSSRACFNYQALHEHHHDIDVPLDRRSRASRWRHARHGAALGAHGHPPGHEDGQRRAPIWSRGCRAAGGSSRTEGRSESARLIGKSLPGKNEAGHRFGVGGDTYNAGATPRDS